MKITSPYPRTHSHNPSPRPHQTSAHRLLTTIAVHLCLVLPLVAQSPPPQIPPNNATVDFGAIFTGQPTVQWIKITQSSPSASVAITSSIPGTPYLSTLVEDTGFGHGQPPPSAYSTNPSGPCTNCWLGLRFTPQSPGPETGSVTLTPAPLGSPYTLSLTGVGLPVTGLLLTPITHDFGSIPIHSSSAPQLFTVTNLNPAATSVNLANPTLSGDFSLASNPTGGPICGGPLTYTASCFLEIAFNPTTPGPLTGAINLQAGSLTSSAQLTGTGIPDPGLTLNPAALVFDNVPGSSATSQTIALTNTSSVPEQISQPTLNSPNFTASTTCQTLAPGASCPITISFSPTFYQPTSTLAFSVTSSGNLTQYTVPLGSTYTTQTVGLQIIPNDTQFPPQPLSTLSTPRQFMVNNLTAKSLAFTFAFPRQFAPTTPPCTTLGPGATCTFSAAFAPLTTGDTTGSLFVTGIPTDATPSLTGIAYYEAYGATANPTDLTITGPGLQSSTLNFGQIPSGHTAQRTLTLTNPSSLPINIRRITSPWPYLATSNCLAPITTAISCAINLTYAPINQAGPNSSPPPFTTDTAILTIESEAASSPNLINLTGTSTPVAAANPLTGPFQPILMPSQSSLTFTANLLATPPASQTVLLANSGTTALTITSITSSAQFPVTHNCTTLAPAESCNLTVSFAPQTPNSSPYIAAIEIYSNASAPLEFLSLLGVAGTSALSLNPSTLDFGTQLVGTSTTLSAQLTNNGTLPATLISLASNSDYRVSPGTCPTGIASLAPNTTCTVQVTFTPTNTGARPGTFTIVSSDPTLTISLIGLGAIPPPPPPPPPSPTFTLTANGASSAAATITAGSSAAYTLNATPLHGFTGPLPLTCIPISSAPYANCSIVPATLTLASAPQTATLTISTQSSSARLDPRAIFPGASTIAACLLVPTFLFCFTRFRTRPALLALLVSVALLSFTACGRIVTPYLRQSATAAGTYTYQATATSSATPIPITQTVTLTLTVR